MNASPDTATRAGAFLALAIADALTLGLPDPGYITMHPSLAGSATTSAAGFQFSSWGGRDPLPDLRAWAAHFGATVAVSADDPSVTWHEFDFTHAGVLIHAYASIKVAVPCPDVPGSGELPVPTGMQDPAPVVRVIADDEADCARPGCGHARHHHWEFGPTTPDAPSAGCDLDSCPCAAYALPETAAAR